MKLSLNPKSFVKDFIEPIGEISKDGKITVFHNIEDDEIYSISANKTGLIRLYNTFKCLSVEDPIERFSLNINRLVKGLLCIDKEEQFVDLNVDDKENTLRFNSESIQFMVRLLNANLIQTPKFNVSTFKQMNFQYKVEIDASKVLNIKKALEFSSQTGKFYLEKDGNSLYFLFGDKTSTSNDTDSIRILAAENVSENIPCRIYDLEILKLILKTKNDFSMNLNENGLMFIEIENNTSKLKYITTPLVK